MFAPQYRTDPRVPGIGLAFFRADLGAHRTVEHQGILPGFNSQIWVAPDDGVGVVRSRRSRIAWASSPAPDPDCGRAEGVQFVANALGEDVEVGVGGRAERAGDGPADPPLPVS